MAKIKDIARSEIETDSLIGSVLLALLLALLVIWDTNLVWLLIVGLIFMIIFPTTFTKISESKLYMMICYFLTGVIAVIASVVAYMWGEILGSFILSLLWIYVFVDLYTVGRSLQDT